MKQLILLSILLSCCFRLSAQAQTIDFGEIKKKSRRFTDVSVTNTSELSKHIVKIEHSPQITYRVDRDYINPDSSLTLRIQVNPDTTGNFDHVLRILLSNEEVPLEIRIKGNVKEMPDYSDLLDQRTPEFGKEDDKKETEFMIASVDAETGEVITRSNVTIIRNGRIAESWLTGSKGTLNRKASPGFLYFIVSHSGYETTETGVYITPDIETVYIPLRKSVEYHPFREQEEQLPEEEIPERLLSEEEAKHVLHRQIEHDQESDETTSHVPGTFESYPNDYFDSTLFRPVNIVFVLDVSSSMKMGEKMNLLKYALNELTNRMRPQDRISFVTYSQGARIYMKQTYCSNKQIIRSKIDALQAEGNASDTKGIRVGYKEVKKDLDPSQTNMVVVITDGAFNKYSNDYQKTVGKYAQLGVTFSVVGIQCRSNDERNMQEAAAYGNGAYIAINRISDADYKLFHEIRRASFKVPVK